MFLLLSLFITGIMLKLTGIVSPRKVGFQTHKKRIPMQHDERGKRTEGKDSS